jgi:hypothetical protein
MLDQFSLKNLQPPRPLRLCARSLIVPVFGKDATQFGKFLQAVYLRNELVSERHCTVRIVTCDEDDYVVQIVASSSKKPRHSESFYLVQSLLV